MLSTLDAEGRWVSAHRLHHLSADGVWERYLMWAAFAAFMVVGYVPLPQVCDGWPADISCREVAPPQGVFGTAGLASRHSREQSRRERISAPTKPTKHTPL